MAESEGSVAADGASHHTTISTALHVTRPTHNELASQTATSTRRICRLPATERRWPCLLVCGHPGENPGPLHFQYWSFTAPLISLQGNWKATSFSKLHSAPLPLGPVCRPPTAPSLEGCGGNIGFVSNDGGHDPICHRCGFKAAPQSRGHTGDGAGVQSRLRVGRAHIEDPNLLPPQFSSHGGTETCQRGLRCRVHSHAP